MFYYTCFMRLLLTGSVLLLFVAAGLRVPLHAHYCGGELQDLKAYLAANSCCEHKKHNTAHYTSPCCKEKKSTYVLPNYRLTGTKLLLKSFSQTADYQKIVHTLFRSYFSAFCRAAPPGRAPPQRLSLFLLYATLRL